MPPPQKKFVKTVFDQSSSSRPRQSLKEKDYNTGNRSRKNVSYTEKSSIKQNVLKDMINSYIPFTKPSRQIIKVCKQFQKYFTQQAKKPQPYTNDCLNNHLVILSKKPIYQKKKAPLPQPQSQQDPDWDSDSDVEGGIESKQISQEIIKKVTQKISELKPIRNEQLKRHQKQFLQEYFRQKKHQNQVEQAQIQTPIHDQTTQDIQRKVSNQWTDYQEKQVNNFVQMGFLQKVAEDQEDFSDGDDFSVQEEKSAKSSSSESSQEQDDIFGDQGPSTVVKKQEVQEKNAQSDQSDKKMPQGTVVINTETFSKLASAAGLLPNTCVWIISNKQQSYRVTTEYMDKIYRANELHKALPYISLNHSQFVLNSEVETPKGIEILKNYNSRKYHRHVQHRRQYQNQQASQPKRQYKSRDDNQGPQRRNNRKTHLNKK